MKFQTGAGDIAGPENKTEGKSLESVDDGAERMKRGLEVRAQGGARKRQEAIGFWITDRTPRVSFKTRDACARLVTKIRDAWEPPSTKTSSSGRRSARRQ